MRGGHQKQVSPVFLQRGSRPGGKTAPLFGLELRNLELLNRIRMFQLCKAF